jgi:hypothetical protein
MSVVGIAGIKASLRVDADSVSADRRRRVVIVYERAGQGHRAAADVLRSVLEADADVEVVLQDGAELESDRPGDNPFIALWNTLVRRGWFRLADLLLNHWFRLVVFPVLMVTAASRVKDRLKALRPDAVVTTADVFSRPLGDVANELGVPFTVLPTEFSIFADLLHPDAHYLCYFEEMAQALRRFDLTTPHFRIAIDDRAPLRARLKYLAQWVTTYGVRRTEPLLFQAVGDPAPGLNSLHCHVIGPLRKPEDHAPPIEPSSERRPQILVVSGSLGGRFVAAATRALMAMPDLDADVVAICGRDHATLQRLRTFTASAGGVRVECHGYVDDMPARLRRASLVLTRPSAGVFLEAVLAGVPLLMPAPAMRNDSGTIDLVRLWKVGETYGAAREIPARVRSMLPRLAEYRARLRDVRERVLQPRERREALVRSVVWRSVQESAGRPSTRFR